MVAWSVALAMAWRLDWMTSTALAIMSTYVGLQYLVGKTVREYELAYYWYNVRNLPGLRTIGDAD